MTLVQATLDYNDASKLLGVGRSTLYKLAKSGELATMRHGKKTRFVISSIEDYCNRQLDSAVADAKSKRSR